LGQGAGAARPLMRHHDPGAEKKVLSQSLTTHQKTRILFSARHIWTSSFRKFSLVWPNFWIIWHSRGINVDLQRTKFFKKKLCDSTGLQSLNAILKFTGTGRIINIVQSKYLNNMVEQDHRFIKKITRPMLGFKAFYSAAATLAGIEVAHMIRKGQRGQNGMSPFKQFAALAG
jgi:hypothetical protein